MIVTKPPMLMNSSDLISNSQLATLGPTIARCSVTAEPTDVTRMMSMIVKTLSTKVSSKVARVDSEFARASLRITYDSGAAMGDLAQSTTGHLVREMSLGAGAHSNISVGGLEALKEDGGVMNSPKNVKRPNRVRQTKYEKVVR